jgi:hypothetical protein
MSLTNAQDVDSAVETQLNQVQSLTQDILQAATSYINGFRLSSFYANPISADYVKFAPSPIKLTDEVKPSAPRVDLSMGSSPKDVAFLSLAGDLKTLQDLLKKLASDPMNVPEDFQYEETPYESALWDATKAKLLSAINSGGQTLPTAIQQGAWNASYERNLIALQEAKERMADNFAERGWSMPDGALAAEWSEADLKFAADQLEQSLKIAYEQAKLALENDHFNVTSSIAFETMSVTHAENVANRALRAASLTVELGLSIMKIIMEKYSILINSAKAGLDADAEYNRDQVAELQAHITKYRTDADVKLGVLRGKVDVFRGQLASYGLALQKGEAEANITVKQQEMVLNEQQQNAVLALDAASKNMQSFIQESTAMMAHDANMGHVWANFLTGVLNAITVVMNLGSQAQYNQNQQLASP